MAGQSLARQYRTPNQLETAILNLVINARDAMPNGGRITLTTQDRHISEDARSIPGFAARGLCRSLSGRQRDRHVA